MEAAEGPEQNTEALATRILVVNAATILGHDSRGRASDLFCHVAEPLHYHAGGFSALLLQGLDAGAPTVGAK